MAREIHDTLAQGLTGIITQLQAAEQAADDPAGWRRHFERRDRSGPGEPVRGPPVGRGATLRVAGDGPAERGAGRSGWALVRPARDTGPGHHHRDGTADAARSRVRAAAHRAGGAGQRGQARLRDPGRGDPVLHGAGRRAGRARRRPGLRPRETLRRGHRDQARRRAPTRHQKHHHQQHHYNSSITNSYGRSPVSHVNGLVGLSVSESLRHPAAGHRTAAASAWSRCASASRAWPARCRSSRSRASAPASRPASRSPLLRPAR